MTRRNTGRPGPGGTRIYSSKPRGCTARVPATKAEAAAARVAALKHGGSAKVVTVREAHALAVEKTFGKGAREVLDAYHAGISDGDPSGVEALAIRGMTDLEMIRRDMATKVAKQGAVLKESIVSPASGEVVGERIRLHPAVEGVARFSELLGRARPAGSIRSRRTRARRMRRSRPTSSGIIFCAGIKARSRWHPAGRRRRRHRSRSASCVAWGRGVGDVSSRREE